MSKAPARDRGTDGRFVPGNNAARTTGLRSAGRSELRRRTRRVGRWTRRLSTAFADSGRPLAELSLPLAQKWSELETMRVDLYLAFTADPANDKLHERYLATCRLQVQVEHALGMTPALSASMRPDDSMTFLKSIASKRRERVLPDAS